jgi:Uma2 family endonuclease
MLLSWELVTRLTDRAICRSESDKVTGTDVRTGAATSAKRSGTLGYVSDTARQLVSRAEYICFERDSTIRHEWVGNVLFAMTGTSGIHNRIAGRLSAKILAVADPHGCRTYASDMRVMTADAGYYPDVMVACDEQADPYFETMPCLLAEILSPSTRDIDQREKRAAYFGIESLRHYLVVHQDQPRIEHHWRSDATASWQLEVVGPIDTITLICPPMTLPVGALFDGLVPY